MSARKRFSALLEARRELVKEFGRINEEGNAYIMGRVRGYKPRWKGDDSDIRSKAHSKLELWEMELLRAPAVDDFNRRYAELVSERNWLDHRLNQLAQEAAARPGPGWLTYQTVYGSSYATQGFGATSYARGRAKLHELEARLLGVEARVTERPRETVEALGRRRALLPDFLVEVKVAEPVDVEILRRQPAADLRDMLKACWGMGLNPRVYLPGLPHGIEQRMGLDYQGREIG